MRLARTTRGFSLAELLIVVFIIGLVSTIIVLRFRTPTHEATPQTFSQDMLRYMQIIQEQAIIKPGVLGIKFYKHEYQVFYLKTVNKKQGWIPLSDRSQFWEPRNIPTHIVLKLQLTETERQFLKTKGENQPDILFLPSGEVTPFVLQLREDDDAKSYTIRGDEAGNLILGAA